MSRGFSELDSLISILAGTVTVAAIVLSQPTAAIAKTAQEVAQLAQTTTVQINNSFGDPGGTGVMIAKQGNTYTVLTANHVVVSSNAEYTVHTSTGKEYPATQVQRLQTSKDEPDLAVVQFSSPDNYAIATLGNSEPIVVGSEIYVGGYPLPSLGTGKEREFLFTKGIVSSRPKSRPQGYTLRYDAVTRVGMSGGPVFDILGRVVGIHGQADIDDSVAGDSGETVAIKTGINAGIPINTFMALKSQIDKVGASLVVDKTPTGDNPTARLSNPQTARDYYTKGLSQFDQDDYLGAIENYTQALRLDPNLTEAYSKRAAAKLLLIGYSTDQLSLPKNRGAIQEALQDFNQALQFNPSDAYAYSGRGYISYALGEEQAAMEDANQALRLDPNEADGYNLRGLLRDDLDDYQGAIADFNQAIRLNPNLYHAYGNRSLTRIKLKDYQGAMEDANRAIQIKPNSALTYLVRSFVRLKQEDYRGAIADVNQSLQIHPNNHISYALRGAIRFKLNDYQRALEDVNQSLQISPNSAETYYFRANVRDSLKDPQGAIEDYNQALRINPTYVEAYVERAVIRFKQNDYQGALEDLNQAIASDRNYADGYAWRGLIRYRQGDKQGGLEDMQKAANLFIDQGDTQSYQEVLEIMGKLQQ